jgi:hypothetical protein
MAVQHRIALVDDQHRAFDAGLQLRPGDHHRNLEQALFSGSRPLISQSSQTRFWSLLARVTGGQQRPLRGGRLLWGAHGPAFSPICPAFGEFR